MFRSLWTQKKKKKTIGRDKTVELKDFRTWKCKTVERAQKIAELGRTRAVLCASAGFMMTRPTRTQKLRTVTGLGRQGRVINRNRPSG